MIGKPHGWAALGALAALLAASAVCAAGPPVASENTSTQIRNVSKGGIMDRSSRSPAEALFVEKCGMCHRQMGMGTLILARRMSPSIAMLEERKDLTPEFIVRAARTGIGNMPRMQRGEVSDAQLTIIARYLSRRAN